MYIKILMLAHLLYDENCKPSRFQQTPQSEIASVSKAYFAFYTPCENLEGLARQVNNSPLTINN